MRTLLLHNWPWFVVVGFIAYVVYEYWRYRQFQTRAGMVEPVTPPLLPAELILVRSVNQLSARQRGFMYTAAVFFVLATLGLMYVIVAAKHPDAGVMELLQLVSAGIKRQPGLIYQTLFIATILFGIPRLSKLINQRERLILDRSGIRYQSLFRGPFSVLNPSWQLGWSEIESVAITNYLVRGRVVIKPYHGKRRVLLAHLWYQQAEFAALWKLPVIARLRELRRRQTDMHALMTSPLIRYCREVGGLEIDTSVHAERDFDLFKHPLTRMLVVVLFGLIGYGLVDFPANSETYVAPPPLLGFALGGLILMAGLVIWQRRHRVPALNAWGLATLLGSVFALALYPGLLRINQLTDTAGLQQVEYRHVGSNRFSPVQANLPELVLPSDAYWQSIPENQLVVFSLRHGRLGFYQIDMAPVYVRMRHWYCLRWAGQDPLKLRNCGK